MWITPILFNVKLFCFKYLTQVSNTFNNRTHPPGPPPFGKGGGRGLVASFEVNGF